MKPFVVLGVLNLVLVLATYDVSAQAITVTPADPTISIGQTQQFTASGIDTAIAVEAGAFHTCALLEDTTVRCWGLNDYGPLGDGTQTDSSTPVAVAGLTGAAAVTGGGFHTCAGFPDGTLECWGRNDYGQLGDPATTGYFSAARVPVTGITTATAVTGGGYHTCALLQDGTVRCWGRNDFGQLGNGAITPRPLPTRTPVEVTGIDTAVAVSAGGWHTCALLQDGTVRCWGQNSRGQVGDGSPLTRPETDRPTPTPATVVGITTAVAIKSGIFHTCALLQDGTMQCWGWNDFFQLGNTTSDNYSSTPVTVNGITPAALAPGAEHTCVILQDGTVNCWGDNGFGQNGNGSPSGIFAPPTPPVPGITTATALTSGAEHSCALLPGGTVQCWGRGLFGRLGDGTTTGADAFTPVTVVGLGVTWTSSDTTVATIDEAGLATGRSQGVVIITAASDGRSGSTTLRVGTTTRPTLLVTLEGTGSGTVTSGDGLINCGATCSASYDSGTQVTLTATPAAGFTFEGWTRGCAGTATSCTVTVTADTTVSARFGIPRFTLSVTRQGAGTVISNPPGINCGNTCSASYNSGTQVTLTATPAFLYVFTGWGGGSCSGTDPCTVTLTADTTVTARFRLLGVFF